MSGAGACLYATRGYILLALELLVVDLLNSWLALTGRDGAQVHSSIHARPACEMLVSGRGSGNTARTD
jgi:hypothetical protein